MTTTPDGVQVLVAREVPLGGQRAMTVRRTLPQRGRTFVGAWCFCDHYGPEAVADLPEGGMLVPPHPHTGLATVSWLFEGEIEHRDSAGHHVTVRPGELNLMTAGRGISHSEYSTARTSTLHGAQLWFALPARARDVEPAFVHHLPEPVALEGVGARVFLGTLGEVTSPVPTPSPLLGAQLDLPAGATLRLPLDPDHEHALLLDAGDVTLDGVPLPSADLVVLARGGHPELRASTDTRLLLLGGEPLGEEIVMWWNFVGGSHDEIVAARDEWQALVDEGTTGGRFRLPEADPHRPLPAPELPHVRLRPRR